MYLHGHNHLQRSVCLYHDERELVYHLSEVTTRLGRRSVRSGATALATAPPLLRIERCKSRIAFHTVTLAVTSHPPGKGMTSVMTSRNSLTVVAARLLLLSGVIGACRSEPAPRGPTEAAPTDTALEYTQLPLDSARELLVTRVHTIALGTANSTPKGISSLRAAPAGGFVLLDGISRSVRWYERSGRERREVSWQDIPEISRPIALTVDGDKVFVVDVDPRRGAARLDSLGHTDLRVAPRLATSISDVVPRPSEFVFAAILEKTSVAAGRAHVLAWTRANGDTIRTACAPEAVYRNSAKRDGMYALFVAAGVRVFNGLVFCRQPASPVVQVYDTLGALRTVLRVAPPFYRRPADVHASMNPQRVDQFRSTFTEHLGFWPHDQGFISVYSQFDLTRGTTVYRLFSCDSYESPTVCGTAETDYQPVDFIAPDTLVAIDPTESGQNARAVSLLRVSLP